MTLVYEKAGKDERNVWLTPFEIVQALGPFDLDPCFLPNGVRPWNTAAKHYSEIEDGLKQPWKGRVWLNPPYGRETTKWMKRMVEHGDGIALVFSRTDNRFFHDYIFPYAQSLFFTRGRISFCDRTGKQSTGSAAGSVFVHYGKADINTWMRLIDIGIEGTVIYLRDDSTLCKPKGILP